jgi:hypothetical protein
MSYSVDRWSLVFGWVVTAWAAAPVWAVDKTWTPTMGADFFEDANWLPPGAPGVDDKALILNPATTAHMNFTGVKSINSFHLGETGATGGNVRFSAGELHVPAEGNARSHIGDRNSVNSTFIMDGTAVMLFDQPLDGLGLGGSQGNQDLEIGAQTGASGALGKLEVHDNAVLRISDDLKIGAEIDGNGEVLIDGNAIVTVGSGVSVSEADRSRGRLTVGGNALLVSGNSAGAGNTAQGFTDEGYLTVSIRSGAVASTADVLIKDAGKLYIRTLQHRGGTTNFTVQDNGEFHIFDTFAHAAPNLGVATVTGDPSGPRKASSMGDTPGAVFNLTLKNNAKMSVDSAVDNGSGLLYQGLGMSGGNNLGQILGTGGESTIDISDNASFVVQQNLHMTLASSDLPTGAASTLRVKGPNANVEIKGDLYMSFDPTLMLGNADRSTIEAVITGNSHSTIEVGDLAHIEFGNLSVKLDGYAPVGGEVYTLLTANSIVGSAFRATDFSMAPLPAGLTWDLDVGTNSIVLNVMGSLPGVPGDFNGNNVVDAADYVLWRKGGALMNDPTPGNQPEDYDFWRARFGNTAVGSATASAVPEPATVLQLMTMFACGLAWIRRPGR